MPPSTTTADSSTTQLSFVPDICTGHFDAVANLRGEIFIFKGDHVWRLNQKLKILDGYPIPWRALFPSFPAEVTSFDAVYERSIDDVIIFFSGKHYWAYDGENFIEDSPQPVGRLGLPMSLERVDAAMVWGKKFGSITPPSIAFIKSKKIIYFLQLKMTRPTSFREINFGGLMRPRGQSTQATQ